MFYNFTSKPFTARWDSKPYTFQPGQVAESNKIVISDDGQHSVQMTEGVSQVFAHHLAISILNNPKLDVNFIYNEKGEAIAQDMQQGLVYNNASIESLKARAMNMPGVAVDMPSTLDRFLKSIEEQAVPVVAEPEVAEQVIETVEEKKKPGRPKKVASPSENVDFQV